MHERRTAACALALITACYDPSPPLGSPCTTTDDCPEGQQCDTVELVCTLPTEVLVWRDDSAADFSAAGAYLDEVTIESQGFVGPAAFFTGGVRVAGIASQQVADETTATFEQVTAAPLTGTALARGFAIDYGTGIPLGLGLSSGEDVTVVVEGEVELDVAGMWAFELTANDRGFLEIAPPGSSEFHRLVTDDNSSTRAVFEVATPGWHRVRGAFARSSGGLSFELRYDPPNVNGNFRAIPSDRIRAPIGDLGGLLVDGFEEAFMLGPRGSVVSTESLANQTFGTDPFGFDVGASAYTLRWSGQFLVDVEGEYAFRIESVQGQRAWIDGVQVADALSNDPEVTVTSPVPLVPGWHDLVIDIHNASGDAQSRLAFTVESGPALVGESFPADRVRPVVGRGARWIGGENLATVAVPDVGTASTGLSLDLPANLIPLLVDVSFEVNHPALATVQVVLAPPAGGSITLASFGGLSGAGAAYRHRQVPESTTGTGWSFVVSDNTADALTGSIVQAEVTVIGNGGVAPFPTSYRYVSATRELGDVAAIGAMTWGLRQAADPAAATVSIRTCDVAAACQGEPWTEVTLGTAPAVAPRRFAQYQVDVTTNGDVPTALDFIELAYSARLP